MKKQYDVVIIGAGVVGSAIARELSRYKLSIAVLEKNLDVCNETSGRNSAVVHGGFANPTGSLKAKCCVEGNKIMDQLAEELDFPFKRCGKVLVGNTPEDMEQLERTMKQGAVNGCTGLEMIDEKSCMSWCPPWWASLPCGPRTAVSWTRSCTPWLWPRTHTPTA